MGPKALVGLHMVRPYFLKNLQVLNHGSPRPQFGYMKEYTHVYPIRIWIAGPAGEGYAQRESGSGAASRFGPFVNSAHTNPPGGLENYYRDNVIGGPGAFVIVAQNVDSFGDTIIKKLVAEIAGGPHRQQAAVER